MIIDCHGHYTTAPPELEAWRKRQIAALGDPSKAPKRSELSIRDDQIRESLENAQLRMQRERGTDLTIFSPRRRRVDEPRVVDAVQRPRPPRLPALS